MSTGASHEYHEVKGVPTNSWRKVYNGLWDDAAGGFKNYETPRGSKRLCYTKTKVVNDFFLALSDQCDVDIKDNENTLPSFVMAKNTHNDYINMTKDKERTKKEVDDKRQQ